MKKLTIVNNSRWPREDH